MLVVRTSHGTERSPEIRGSSRNFAPLLQLFANESVPDHVGYAKVKITLINENDNRPIFSQPLYNVSLYENITVGTSVLTVLVSPQVHRGHKLLDILGDTEHLGIRCRKCPESVGW
jgi:hypothetical protein